MRNFVYGFALCALAIASGVYPAFGQMSFPAVPEPGPAFSVSVRGGITLPEAPSAFADVRGKGNDMGASVNYNVVRWFSFGLFMQYATIPHNGKSLKYMNEPYLCFSGGAESFTSIGLRAQMQLLEVSFIHLYCEADLGAVRMYQEQTLYRHGVQSIAIPDYTTDNLVVGGGLGIEIPFTRMISFDLGVVYNGAEDGILVNQFATVCGGVKVSF